MTMAGDNKTPIWDLTVRLFHWALVVAVCLALFSGTQDKMMTGYDTMHVNAGVTVLILAIHRLLWGLVGSETARFSSFLAGPKTVLAYLKAVKNGEPFDYVGHNPLGGWSVFAMLLLLLAQPMMGLFSTDAMFFDGPLAAKAGDMAGQITAIHRITGWTLLGLIILHVGAVLYYGLVKRTDLVRPMVTGKGPAPRTPEMRSQLLSLALFLVVGASVCLTVF